VNSTANGVNWTGMQELRPEPDTSPPFNNTFESADWRPTVEIFNNRLYCAWESNSTITTTGLDRDIILRSSADGFNWDANVVNVTDTWEDDYSKNLGMKNDLDADMVVFNNSLWLVWVTNNTDAVGGFKRPANDIMISNSSDGITWRNATDLTSGDDWYANDISPSLAVFNNSLYVAWSSNNTDLNKGIDDQADYDIIYCNTSDGSKWSAPDVLNPNDNDLLTKKGSLDIQPTLAEINGKLYCTWASASNKYTEGTDYDIVLGYSTNGNLTELQNHNEVSNPSSENPEHSPKLIEFDSRVYVAWVSENVDDSEIYLRYQSLTDAHWGDVRRVNPLDTGGADYYPDIEVFNNDLYIAWVSNDTSTSIGYDKDVMLRTLEPSYLPVNFGLDVGGDGSWEISTGTLLSNSSNEFDLTAGLQSILADNDWVAKNSSTKNYGNQICNIPMVVNFNGPGRIIADNLDVYYDYSVVLPDFSADINYYIDLDNVDLVRNGKYVIPFTIDSDTAGKIKISELTIIYNHKPEISIVDIPGTGKTVNNPVYRVQWSATDVDDNASISLYYDTDDYGYDGELIIANLSEDSANSYYDWVWWKTLPEGGIYYLYANITDGKAQAQNYSVGPLILNEVEIKDFIDITLVEPDGIDDEAWDNFQIEWLSHCPDEDAKIYLFYDNDTTGFDGYALDINNNGYFDTSDFVTESPDDGPGNYLWDMSMIPPGEEYFIYARITNKWNISVYNYSTFPLFKTHMPGPRQFTMIDDTDPNDDNLTTHKKNPRLSWQKPDTEITDNLGYELTVWTGQDRSGNEIYNITTVATSITILNGLDFNQTYYSEVFAQSESGARSLKSSLEFRVLNHAPGAPAISITPKMPKTTDILLCSITNDSFDADNDIVNYTFNWYKDGALQSQFNNLKTVPSESTSKGEQWTCVVIPSDSFVSGINATASVVIGNSAPVLEIIEPNTDKKYKASEAIIFNFSVTDADSVDRAILNFKVFSDNQIIKEGYVPSTRGRVEFFHELAEGTHELRFNVSDGDDSSEHIMQIEVNGKGPSEQDPAVLYGFYTIIIVIIVLILIFMLLLMQVKRMRGEVEDELDQAELEPEDLEDAELEDEELTDEEPDLATEDPGEDMDETETMEE
jgi:hypothetical protein